MKIKMSDLNNLILPNTTFEYFDYILIILLAFVLAIMSWYFLKQNSKILVVESKANKIKNTCGFY